MAQPFSIFVCFLLFVSAAVAHAEAQKDGTIVEQMPCPSNTMGIYEQWVESYKRWYTRDLEAARREGFQREIPRDLTARLPSKEEFERRKAYEGFECRRIKYLSDGLKVVGYIWKPTDTAGKKLPLIVYNRGGNREFGKLSPWYRSGFYHFLSHGFVVIGSQYRGNDGGEGREEFGGADVRDVMNLLPLAERLGYVDMNNVFLLGESRGGMMTYLALKHHMLVNAAAVIGGLADVIANGKERPEMVEHVYKQLIPDLDKGYEERLRERSAVHWPEKITVPVLIMHGGADWRLDTRSHTLALAQGLQEHRKEYELIIYAQDDHGLSLNRADSDRRIVEWFKRYMK